jgi:hypothetical protein
VTAAKASDVPSRVQQVLDVLPGAHPSGDGWAARCPAHPDGSPSLVVSVGEDEYQPVVWCHGECDYADVRAARPDSSPPRASAMALSCCAKASGTSSWPGSTGSTP